ncbi:MULTISPECIES: GIY-YIG nuclease family protein [unclassified Bradyrhizobium]|uniref:GIY-YIG nuclease family protein n=1 Tax=unclassified Bradyrhizobium TaxID=2631580 RepID=UPI0028E4AEE3|nr:MULTISPECIES: GIY-YIG nuclease family protein [unclassified Bradyrhizobium]
MRARILSEIERLAEANGGQAPGVRAFESATGITEGTWRGLYWARWSDALAEAGYAANKFQGKSEADHILASFVEAARYYKRLPTIMEIRMFRRQREDFPNEKTIHSYFGSKEGLISNLRAWLEGRSGYDDIVQMLGQKVEAETPTNSREGLVYLIKSGTHYKIGRSDELERRVKEIRIALPEAATLVHSIRTDDPAGIEAYWHRRFVDKRANGEWFKLTNADVAAFKKRRYQ